MSWVLWVILALVVAFILLLTGLRVVRKASPSPIPFSWVWLLDNPLRRLIFSPKRLLDAVGIREGMQVLEIGPGPGHLTVEAAPRLGRGKLYGLDIEPRMIARARRKLIRRRLNNVHLIVGNATSLPFAPESFDLAFMIYVSGEIPYRERALRELARVLRPGGVLSISEVVIDFDYSLKSTILALGRQAGFEPFEEKGNFFAYTINFRCPA